MQNKLNKRIRKQEEKYIEDLAIRISKRLTQVEQEAQAKGIEQRVGAFYSWYKKTVSFYDKQDLKCFPFDSVLTCDQNLNDRYRTMQAELYLHYAPTSHSSRLCLVRMR
mgnify:CR=1 FL=1